MNRATGWRIWVLAMLAVFWAGGLFPGADAWAVEVRIEASSFTFDRDKNQFSYENGRLRSGDLNIFAPRVVLDVQTKTARASGLIRLETGKIFGSASEMVFDTAANLVKFKNVNLFDTEHGLYIRAQEMSILPGGKLRIVKCDFTTCAPDVALPWSLSASELEFLPSGMALAWNPIVYLGPVPAFWLPAIVWPIVRERRTGLLPPVIEKNSSSLPRLDLGYRFKIPVFLNLNVDHDLTLRPEYIQKRGQGLGLEYNYAFRPGLTGKMTAFGLAESNNRDPLEENDILGAGQAALRDPRPNRFLLDWEHNQGWGDSGRLVASYHHSSDGQVRQEYQRISQLRPFQSYQATLSQQRDWGEGALTFEQNADYTDESLYADHAGATDRNRRPRLMPRFSGRLGGVLPGPVPLDLTMGLTAAAFEAEEDLSGVLTVVSPELNLPLRLGGAYRLRLSFRRDFVDYGGLTQYQSGQGQVSINDESYAQTEAEMEFRTAYARVFSGGVRFEAIKHRLEPRLIYREVEDVPQLWKDRVLRARVAERLLVFRLDNTLLGRRKGGEVLELFQLNLTQRYNFLRKIDPETLTVTPLSGPGFDRAQETLAGQPLLPLILEAKTQGTRYTLSGRLNYHHQLGHLNQVSLSWSGKAGPYTELALGYGFNEFTHLTPDNKVVPKSNAFNLNGQTALSNTLSLGFKGRINLSDETPPLDKRIDSTLVFLEYRPPCYSIRLSIEEDVVTVVENNQESYVVNRRVALTFNLKGFVGARQNTGKNARKTPTPGQETAMLQTERCRVL